MHVFFVVLILQFESILWTIYRKYFFPTILLTTELTKKMNLNAKFSMQFLSQNNTLPHGEYGKVKKQTIFSNSRHQKYTARQKILHLNRSSPGKHRWPLCPFYIHKARGECQEQTLFISLLMFITLMMRYQYL